VIPRLPVVALSVVAALLCAGAGRAYTYVQDNAWVSSGEAGFVSTDSEENISLRPNAPNLCGDPIGIPGGLNPNWVRSNGSTNPSTPFVEAEGQVLPDAIHATTKEPIDDEYKTNPFVANTDDTFTHYMRDFNVFMTLDPSYRYLLANGNFADGAQNENGELEVEWERSGPPLWAWPAANDRIHVWGNHIWDCAHGGPYPFGSPNIRRTEIHPPVGWVVYRNLANTHDRTDDPGAKKSEDPWVWYEAGDHHGMGTTIPFKGPDGSNTPSGLFATPVQATVADAFFSSFGGDAIEALNGCDDSGDGGPGLETVNANCEESFPNAWEWAQYVLQQDYTFFVPAPPKPAPDAQLVWSSQDRCSETTFNPGNPPFPGDVEGAGTANPGNTAYNIGSAQCVIPDHVSEWIGPNGAPGILVSVLAHSGADGIAGTADDPAYPAAPAKPYVAFGTRYRVAWDYIPTAAARVHAYQVSVDTLRVYDDNEPCFDIFHPFGDDGEWVMSLRVNEQWVHPVHGSGDNGDAFWQDGAVDDDKCEAHAPSYQPYPVNESFNPVDVVPGEPINVWEKSFDLDGASEDDINPIVNAYHFGPGTFVSGTTDLDVDGAHTLVYTISDVTDPDPTPGALTIGSPQYDTGGLIRVSALTPITMDGSNAAMFEWKMWKDGFPEPSDWHVDTTPPFDVDTSGFATGNYTIRWAPVSSFGIVRERALNKIQLDTLAPTLNLPPTMLVDATSVNGANVSYSATATDNLPGPVAVTCNPASGSFFPVKQVTTVHCTAEDAVGNKSFGNFLVDVESPFGYVHDFVALGLRAANLGSFDTVISGNVGAFDKALTPGGLQVTEVRIGAGSQLVGGPQVAGDTVRLDPAVLAGEVYAVDPISAGPGAIFAAKKGYVPLFLCLPDFPGFMAFGADLTIKNDTTLAPGNYGALRVAPGKTLTLLGGTYVFKSVVLEDKSALVAIRPTTVEVSLRVNIGMRVKIGAAPGSTNDAHDMVFYVQAPDAPTQLAWQTDDQLNINANVYAKNGTLSIGRGSTAIGAFIGNALAIGNASVLRIDSAFDCPYPPPRPR
jgi:HYR domain